MGLFHILVWSIEKCLGALRILCSLMVLGALNILCQGLLLILNQVHLWCVFYLSVLFTFWDWSWRLSSSQFSSTMFLQIGQFCPHPHCSGLDTVALGTWGSIFIGGFGIVAVTVALEGGMGQSFLISKRLLDILLASGQWVLLWAEVSSKGGGCFLELESGSSDFQHLLGSWCLLAVAAWSPYWC